MAQKRTEDQRAVVRMMFADDLASHRKRLRLSQRELGKRADLHRTEIGRLEKGEHAGIDSVVKLAGALGVEVADLTAGIRTRPRTTKAPPSDDWRGG